VYPVDDSADPAQANGMFAPRSPTFFPFELAADELRKEEFVRLADAVPPTLEALRSLTPAQLRAEVTLMLERLGYLVHSDASAHDLVVTKDGRKYIVACAPPADREPTPTRDLARLHAAVVAATAEGGFYITTRSFTPSAEAYAAGAPIKLVDGEMLIASLKRSKAGAAMPDTYRAMCRQCGDIVQHRLDRPETQA
jgi:restriction endonuclease Mrr